MTSTGDIGTLTSGHTIAAGDLKATFLPNRGMLGTSLQFRGVELLRRIDDLADAAAKGSSVGIPLLYPWANRLAGFRYHAAGREITLGERSSLLHFDGNGLPIHGVPWSHLRWEVVEALSTSITAKLDWNRSDLLTIFPFPHRVEMAASLGPDGLTIQTTLTAAADSPLPVSFGFHPYIGIPNLPRDQWRLRLPAMRHLQLDPRGIPTGRSDPTAASNAPLSQRSFDDGFSVADATPAFSLSGAGLRINMQFLRGYPFAQLFAPPGKDYIAIEPMTAPTNALVTGRHLPIVPPGGRFEAAFRIQVADDT